MERERPRVEHPRCPYCHEGVSPSDEKEPCLGCMAWHHSECWAEHGGCGACGRGVERTPAPETKQTAADTLDGYALEEEIPWTPWRTGLPGSRLHPARSPAGESVHVARYEPTEWNTERRLERFWREARVLAHVPAHPALVRVLGAGKSEGVVYVVSEPCPDQAPFDWELEPLDEDRARELVLELADGVATMTEAGFAHLITSPDNLVLEDGHLRLSILGGIQDVLLSPLASLTEEKAPPLLPRPLLFITPETGRWQASSEASSVYALGLILYRLLTGRHALDDAAPLELLSKRAHVRIPPPEAFCPDLSPRVRRVLGKSLEFDPKQRYESVRAFLSDLRASEAPELEAAEQTLWERPQAGSGLGRTLKLALLLGALLAILLWLYSLIGKA